MSSTTRSRLRWDATDTDRVALARAVHDVLDANSADATLGSEHGWFGIGVPERLGGCGGTFADLAQVAEEVGANVAATPAAWTAAIAGRVLARSDEPPAELITEIVAAARPLAVPLLGRDLPDATSGRLDLEVLTLGPPDALLALPALTRSGPAVLILDPVRDQVQASLASSVDHTRPLSRLRLTSLDVAATTLVTVPDLERIWTATVGTVAALDAVGTARVALTRTIEYSRTREQFGRPIGSFQAYKHRCSSAFIELRLAQALAFGAAEDDTGELGLQAAAHCPRAATRICSEAVVLHGGIGFTWEAGIHAHLKRARLNEVLGSRQGRTGALIVDASAAPDDRP